MDYGHKHNSNDNNVTVSSNCTVQTGSPKVAKNSVKANVRINVQFEKCNLAKRLFDDITISLSYADI